MKYWNEKIENEKKLEFKKMNEIWNCLLLPNKIFHCMDIPHFIYPFISWWMLVWTYVHPRTYAQMFSFGYMSRSEIVVSHNISINAFAASHKFWYVVFSISFISKYFLISLVISSLIHWLFGSVFWFPHICEFPRFLCHQVLVSCFCGQKTSFV